MWLQWYVQRKLVKSSIEILKFNACKHLNTLELEPSSQLSRWVSRSHSIITVWNTFIPRSYFLKEDHKLDVRKHPLTRSSFSASSWATRPCSASTARSTFVGAPVMRITSLWSFCAGIEIFTSCSSIICRTSRPRCPMMKPWYSIGTFTSLVIGTSACKQHGLSRD